MNTIFYNLFNLLYELVTGIFANSLTGLFLMFIVLNVIVWTLRKLLSLS